MDAYEQINPKRFRKILVVISGGFFLAIGLGILLFMLFVPSWQDYFNELVSVAQTYVGVNAPLAYFLGSGLYSMNAASPFFMEVFSAIGPEVEVAIKAAWIPAILTWFVTGFTMGFVCRRWDDGFFSGLLCGIITFIIIQILARIAILGDAQLGAFELGYALVVFLLLVNSSVAVLICMLGGVIGGLLYSKVLFKERAEIAEYM
ncbi:MAG: hypothetical protein EU536_01905 [Promethearchaeota archaeon]|nr:MAG: hypothetical protein EU536_01905 [Candidatus Lokiarchaeota archaeon]